MGNQLIDGHVSLLQATKAVTALLDHVRKQTRRVDEEELLPVKEQHVWLIMTVKRTQPVKKVKPQKIPLAHPLVDPRTSAICLITKDPQREYKDLLESHGVKFISRVIGLQKLRGKFKGFDARRLLLRENDLFLADERVLPLLPSLLGRKWFEAKKQPIPVSLTKKALKTELENAISSTYMHKNQGTCTSVKIARTSQADKVVLDNLVTALPAIVVRIHGGWDNVQSINIKTSGSVSLPVWTCSLGHEQPDSRWKGMIIDEGEWDGVTPRIEEGGNTENVAREEEPGASMNIVTEIVDSPPKLKKVQRAEPSSTSPPQKTSLTRAELAEKKGSLEGRQLTKKKQKLRETEKSMRTGVKTGLVGQSKA